MTLIGDSTFKNCQSLKNVTIPSSVISIGNNSFENCIQLVNITIPSSVTSIGDNAFKKCESLTKMIIPRSVTTIGDNFIFECCGLKKISIPSNISKMGNFNFSNFIYITEFIIPSTVTIISEGAFQNCVSLKKIEIPSSVTKIEQFAFEGCSSLKEITIPPLVTSIEKNTFANCSSLVKVNIPSSVTSIGIQAFSQCNSLVSITIPSSVKYIVLSAFDKCSSLKKIILNRDPKEIKIIEELPNCNKTLLIGGPNVGKTSIIERIIKNRYPDACMPTIGVDFKTKYLEINGYLIKLQIWDTPGSYKFHKIVKAYYRGMRGVIIVFDLTNRKSLDDARMFFEEIKEANIEAPSILLGNKSELEHNVNIEDINELVNKYNSKYFEVSAHNNENIAEAILYLGNEIMKETNIEHCPLKNLLYYNDEKKCNIY